MRRVADVRFWQPPSFLGASETPRHTVCLIGIAAPINGVSLFNPDVGTTDAGCNLPKAPRIVGDQARCRILALARATPLQLRFCQAQIDLNAFQ